MSSIIAWVLGTFLIAICAACGGANESETVVIAAAGDLVTKTFDLDGFDEIEVRSFFEAEIKEGPAFSVEIEAERGLIPYLQVEVRRGKLRVGLEDGIHYSLEDASQRLKVTLPALASVRVGNHSRMVMNGFETDEPLQLEAIDFSALSGSVVASELQIEVSNHSSLLLSGSAASVTGTALGFSSVDLSQLEVEETDVNVDDKSTFKK
jgi:hypothetical protein